MTDPDELEPPRNRKTDPDRGMSDRELLENIERTVDSTANTLHGVCGDLRILSATLAGAVEHWQSLGKRVTELEVRVGKLEAQRMNGSEHPGTGV
jgi:hypothetical protein